MSGIDFTKTQHLILVSPSTLHKLKSKIVRRIRFKGLVVVVLVRGLPKYKMAHFKHSEPIEMDFGRHQETPIGTVLKLVSETPMNLRRRQKEATAE